MKLSVSLPDDDVAVLDAYARQHDLPSRSAAVQRAVEFLKREQLMAQYEVAIDEWTDSEDAVAWEVTVGDGLVDDPEQDHWAAQYRAWQAVQPMEPGGGRAAG